MTPHAGSTERAADRAPGARATPGADIAQGPAADAKHDWEQRIYRRLADTEAADPTTELPAPQGLRATPAVGHIRLEWQPVPGAAGYLVERTQKGGEPQVLQHGGSDVPAVVGPQFADTAVRDRTEYTYRVGAVAGNDGSEWSFCDPVHARTSVRPVGPLQVRVDASRATGQLHRVWRMLGSERLSQLSIGDLGNGHHVGREFRDALALAHQDLGLRRLRAHAILHDDNHVVARSSDGSLAFDFSVVDQLYDTLLELGIRPVVEVGFMPAAIAADPSKTVFTYRAIISPPADWSQWALVCHELASHLVQRYGIEQVATWGFEIWNEPNLEVFWSGTQADYLRLYAEAARAIKAVDDRLLVGGPATAGDEWIDVLARYAKAEGLPLDFVTSHTYGNLPLDNRQSLARHGFGDAPIWWTEWGVGSTHFGPIHDSVAGAPFTLSGFRAVQGRMDALSYWVVSDHFEELGRPPRLFHDGFGLLSVGNLRKPRYWAVHLAEQMGDQVLASDVQGDGADVLVQAWASRHVDGTIDVLVWNGTINGELVHGDPRLDRKAGVRVEGLDTREYTVELARVDRTHSNVVPHAPQGTDWPDEEQMAQLRRHDVLATEQLAATGMDSAANIDVDLPMPSVTRVRLCPKRIDDSQHGEPQEVGQ